MTCSQLHGKQLALVIYNEKAKRARVGKHSQLKATLMVCWTWKVREITVVGWWDPGGNYGGTQVPWDLVGVRVPLPSSLLRLEVRSLHAVLWHSRGLRNGCSKELPAVCKRTSQWGHWAPSSVWLGTPEALPKSSPVQGTPSTTLLGFLHDLGEDEELLLLNYVWNFVPDNLEGGGKARFASFRKRKMWLYLGRALEWWVVVKGGL